MILQQLLHQVRLTFTPWVCFYLMCYITGLHPISKLLLADLIHIICGTGAWKLGVESRSVAASLFSMLLKDSCLRDKVLEDQPSLQSLMYSCFRFIKWLAINLLIACRKNIPGVLPEAGDFLFQANLLDVLVHSIGLSTDGEIAQSCVLHCQQLTL